MLTSAMRYTGVITDVTVSDSKITLEFDTNQLLDNGVVDGEELHIRYQGMADGIAVLYADGIDVGDFATTFAVHLPPQLEEAHYEANQFVLDFNGTALNISQADVETQKADVKASLSVLAVDGGAVIADAISSVDMITANEVRLTFDADVLRAAGVASGDDLKITYNADSPVTAPNTGLLESPVGTDVMSFETGSFKAQLLELQSGMFDNVGAVPQIRIEFTEDLEAGLKMDDVKGNLTAYQLMERQKLSV